MKPDLAAPPRSRRRAAPPTLRVAIYTRKSVEAGAEERFTSLEAQRAAVEAYVTSQAGNGWQALPTRYDDNGFTGAHTDRPAFQRLLQDVERGAVDAIGVYRLDRLSRSTLDTLKLLEDFGRRGITVVSVTEQFSTATPAGNLMVTIISSLNQYERETIAERTRDKMLASRRQGLWTGGAPVLGYDAVDKRLVVNEPEAETVREIFGLYLELGSARKVAKALRDRGIPNKRWKTQGGAMRGGKAFQLSTLLRFLANPLYAGKVRAGDEVVDGQHDAILDEKVWQAAQDLMEGNRQAQPSSFRNRHEALLKGILRCGQCGKPMTHVHTRKGDRRYAYYVCQTSQKVGADACPGSRVAARHVEGFVVDRIRAIGRDPELMAKVVAEAGKVIGRKRAHANREEQRWDAEHERLEAEAVSLLAIVAEDGPAARVARRRMAEIETAVEDATRRADAARAEGTATEGLDADRARLEAALASWDDVWATVPHRERVRLLHLVLEEVVYDAGAGEVELAFRPGSDG